MLQTLMVSMLSVKKQEGFTATPQRKAGHFRQMPLGFTICTVICGNGVRIIGSLTILPLRGMAASIKPKIVTFESRAADRGMNRPRFAEAQRAFKFSNRM